MKNLKYYMSLNYDRQIHQYTNEEGGGYQVSVPLLGSAACVADGDTIEIALKKLELVKRELFTLLIDNGTNIPEPKDEVEEYYSGKFIVRVPIEMHRKLAKEAKAQNISLNSYINYLLSSNLTLDSVFQKVQQQFSISFKEAIETFYSSEAEDTKRYQYYRSKDHYSNVA